MDDDVFLNIPRLFSLLLHKPNPLLIAGHIYDKVAPDRDPSSKWFTPRALYGGDHLPSFVAGFCYILGLKAAQQIFEESRHVPLFHLEDVYLSGLVANERLHLELTDPGDIVVMMYWWQYTYPMSWPTSQLIIHNVPLKQFRCWTRETGDLQIEDVVIKEVGSGGEGVVESSKGSWMYWPMFLTCVW